MNATARAEFLAMPAHERHDYHLRLIIHRMMAPTSQSMALWTQLIDEWEKWTDEAETAERKTAEILGRKVE
jgi:hypothetical protein